MALRIVGTKISPRKGPYVALSYCWGSAKFLRLLKSNESSLKQRAKYSSLPKIFQHAITIIRWFQVEFLGIDSLCILQDSDEDWLKESLSMKDIYENSLLTITNTADTHASIGCFSKRKTNFV